MLSDVVKLRSVAQIVLFAAVVSACQLLGAAERPNIIVILADDQGYSRQQTEAYQVERCVLLVDLTDRP
jgi:hypothetical protein